MSVEFKLSRRAGQIESLPVFSRHLVPPFIQNRHNLSVSASSKAPPLYPHPNQLNHARSAPPLRFLLLPRRGQPHHVGHVHFDHRRQAQDDRRPGHVPRPQGHAGGPRSHRLSLRFGLRRLLRWIIRRGEPCPRRSAHSRRQRRRCLRLGHQGRRQLHRHH